MGWGGREGGRGGVRPPPERTTRGCERRKRRGDAVVGEVREKKKVCLPSGRHRLGCKPDPSRSRPGWIEFPGVDQTAIRRRWLRLSHLVGLHPTHRAPSVLPPLRRSHRYSSTEILSGEYCSMKSAARLRACEECGCGFDMARCQSAGPRLPNVARDKGFWTPPVRLAGSEA